MSEIIGKFERKIRIQPEGKRMSSVPFPDSLKAIDELEITGVIDPRLAILLKDTLTFWSVTNFAPQGKRPAIGYQYEYLKRKSYQTSSVEAAVDLLVQRSNGSFDLVIGPEKSGSAIGSVFQKRSGIPCLPIHKTYKNGNPPEGNYIGAYIPSYTRPGEYDLLQLNQDELKDIIGFERIKVGLIEDIIDTYHVADKMYRIIHRLQNYEIDAE